MTLEKQSKCKVNLLLNIQSRRPDGFHELETVIHPIDIFDRLAFERVSSGVHLTCTHSALPVNSKNLVYRAAALFLATAKIQEGVRMHLEKNIPLAAGLGGGSGNAAATLLGLNELFDHPFPPQQLHALAAQLGSDVPFFLQDKPALATGRGEQIQPLDFFAALRDSWFLLIHPGFGIPTAWAYQQLSRFPAALGGAPGRAARLLSLLQDSDPRPACAAFYNSLEAPALEKYPLLALFQDFLRTHDALGTLMSGSGSTTFAILQSRESAELLVDKLKSKFGMANWLAIVPAES